MKTAVFFLTLRLQCQMGRITVDSLGAFVNEDKLYMLLYIAAQPFYFDKHRDEAEAVIKSARI